MSEGKLDFIEFRIIKWGSQFFLILSIRGQKKKHLLSGKIQWVKGASF